MAQELTETYTPVYAPHVVGNYSKREYEDGKPLPQLVEATCKTCNARYRAECLQGQPRAHISRFAQIHLHRDVLKTAVPTRVLR